MKRTNIIDEVKKMLTLKAGNISETAKRLFRNMNLKSWKVRGGLLALALTLTISGSLYYFTNYAFAAYIVIDGQQAGLVSSVADGKSLVQSVLEDSGQAIGQIAKTKHKIDYRSVWVDDSTLLKESLSKEELRDKLNPYVEGYAIQVAGETVAVLPSQGNADKVLADLKSYYAQPSDSSKVTSVEFQENVTVEKMETEPGNIQFPDQVLAMLEKGKESVKEYTVEDNDSWWLIARKNNMLTQEVLGSNPDIAEDTVLKPGQKISLVAVTPYINVISKGEYSVTETIPFDVITKNDYNLASGQTKIREQGSDGSKEVTYSFVQTNGKITEKSVLAEKTLKEPVDQVIAQGPKAIVSVAKGDSSTIARGTGKNTGFIWPLRGSITSYFGWRSRGFHNGIDIDGYTGDPIVAAAAGKVISAGWNGAYGLSVLLDNGNGISTRYSHASKLLVTPGQSVKQGQKIALVGSTGNSTGSHLDFEVILNGTNLNPLNYLP
ncbi:M23 family metallopeptidase [Paradesulfitobacterium aromaticivorans]